MNEILTDDLMWIAGAAIVLLIVFFFTRKAQYQQRAKDKSRNDPRSKIINTTNYNINQEGIDGHKTQGLGAAGAAEVIDKDRETGYIPTNEEFFDQREDVVQSDSLRTKNNLAAGAALNDASTGAGGSFHDTSDDTSGSNYDSGDSSSDDD